MQQHKPIISAVTTLPEITIKVIILSFFLTIILAVANAYLALKIGLLTSASIPAAIISMGILRFFRNSNILENNLVQTAASAGEAIAGGIVFTIPALIIIHYWMNFSYWQNFFIALCGGVLGVLFTIPLRRVLMIEPNLRYPEGRAIAEVLQAGNAKTIGLKQLLFGGLAGALLEFLQTGVQVVANNMQLWFSTKRFLFGFGSGFSSTMIGAGYLIGFNVGLSLFIGALLGWIIGVPVLSSIYNIHAAHNIVDTVMQLWGSQIRYLGIGAMLVAGLWTLLILFKPFYISIKSSLGVFHLQKHHNIRTERDMPLSLVLIFIFIMLLLTYSLFAHLFPLEAIHMIGAWQWLFIFVSVAFVLFIGFIFSAITGYFSGLVGVTATPGSAMVIAALLITAALLHLILGFGSIPDAILKDAAAIAIIIGSVITGIACIANDNIQDLKVGHLIGATPWKQQVMLLFGAVVASSVIPLVMQLLFNVYGIVDVMPRAGMDPTQTLPAPPAALMAAITAGVFHGNLPWKLMLTGGVIMVLVIIANAFLQRKNKALSPLGVAIGIYLPLSSSIPLFIGSVIALIVHRKLDKQKNTMDAERIKTAKQKGLLLACGLVAGSALMDVILAIPFALARNPNIMQIAIPHWHILSQICGLLSVFLLGLWFYRSVGVNGFKS